MTTLTPELAISAARMDLMCTSHRLTVVAAWMRLLVKGADNARFGHVYAAFTQRAGKGDRYAARKLAEFHQAASAYEGARTALAELTTPTDYDLHQAVCITGPDAKALRQAMAQYAATNTDR